MSSFSCPHLDESCSHCQRLDMPCVPGRPGCVLSKNSVFLLSAAERLRQRENQEPDDSGDVKSPSTDEF